MILYHLRSISIWRRSYFKTCVKVHTKTVSLLCDHFNINENRAEYIGIKHPVVQKLSDEDIRKLIDMVYKLGYQKEVLIEHPLLFGLLPSMLKFRKQVLQECAIVNISPIHLTTYLPLMKLRTIGELKKSGEMLSSVNIENRLASFITQWPTSLTTLIYGNIDETTLYVLRLKILQRYLELVLDLTEEEFYRGIDTYPTIKHRPLAAINETLTILQSQILMPVNKIKNNLYLIHVDPDNLKQIIYSFKSIGGIDIKEIIRLHPKIATRSYSSLVKIRKIFQEFGISSEAQTRCFEIYTLGSDTIKERLKIVKQIPEFSPFINHPRFLRMIFYKNKAMKRLEKLYENNKKCLSLNILAGSAASYESFEKAPGDRLGKGKDLVFYISQALGKQYQKSDIRNSLKRHPFWINIPLVQVKYVHQRLASEFSAEDIFYNCPILLYPWNKISDALKMFKKKNISSQFYLHNSNLDVTNFSKSQILSLVLYLLEKKHYFTGNGVWDEEKNKNLDNVVVNSQVSLQ